MWNVKCYFWFFRKVYSWIRIRSSYRYWAVEFLSWLRFSMNLERREKMIMARNVEFHLLTHPLISLIFQINKQKPSSTLHASVVLASHCRPTLLRDLCLLSVVLRAHAVLRHCGPGCPPPQLPSLSLLPSRPLVPSHLDAFQALHYLAARHHLSAPDHFLLSSQLWFLLLSGIC